MSNGGGISTARTPTPSSSTRIACGIIAFAFRPPCSLMPIPLEDLFDMQTRHLQPQTAITSESPLEIVTPTAQWSYAVWFATVGSVPAAAADARVAISATIDVRAGRVGVGWTRTGSDDFVVERYVAEETDGTIVLRVPVAALPGRLM